ncbi:MAG TPA: type IV secretory system conjugative DNA transfer family protein [Solirubrobacteraceae bacterium]|nr:type IV secretory system conjugative DNA transfer family protein [Solirubrobacteraceae bacterium]
MTDREKPKDAGEQLNLLPALGVALAIGLTGWLVPLAVVAVASRQTLDCSAARAVIGTLRIISESRWSDPASAYPEAVRGQMPGAAVWWTVAGATIVLLIVIAMVAFRKIEPEVARARLGRRSYEWRGSRPRAWARPRDLGDLTKKSTGFSLGKLDGRALTSDPEAHVALIAPTRAGKTTRYIIPWLLEHEGPAIVTSTKRDVLDVTRAHREGLGRVWVYDPFSPDSCAWNPLDGCDDWSTALRQAQWLADATQQGDSEIAGYWRGEAAKLLAPLLHAAVLDNRGVDVVLGWLDKQEEHEPARILKAATAEAAALQLKAVMALDPRNRGTTFMSAGSVLAAYRFPEVIAHSSSDFTPERFFDGTAQTLYIVASDRDQRLLTPLIVALLSATLEGARQRATRVGPLDPTLRVLMDEAANIAPLRDLPSTLSQSAGFGIRAATVWQSVAQLQERFGRAGDTVLANSTVKLFMGPVTDDVTRRHAQALTRAASSKERQSGQAGLAQLTGGRALLAVAGAPPAVVRAPAWWESGRPRLNRNRRVRTG